MPKKIVLAGNSGCHLEIETRDGQLLVVKTAPTKEYSARLKKQYAKQKDFKHHVFKAPRVIDTHEDQHGNFGFSMEYIGGRTLAEHLQDAPIASIPSLVRAFLELIPATHSFDEAAHLHFRKKIKDLREKFDSTNNQAAHSLLDLLDKHEWGRCSSGDCHGDLTLENIIYKNNELYLIDFLDSFYDSWMMDIAKLIFDIDTLWSYRHLKEIDQNLRVRLSLFKDTLLQEIARLPDGQRIIRSIYHMALLHLVRVLPYVKEKKIEDYLLEGAMRLCDTIKKLK